MHDIISKDSFHGGVGISIYRCPNCGEKLEIKGSCYKCINNHSFDISAKKYVNLLINKGGAVHGDSLQMQRARRDFLNLGYYEPLSKCVNDMAQKHIKKDGIIIDAGCAQGYYTSHICGISNNIFGFDISKQGVAMAAKACTSANFCVASVYNMPYLDGCADAVISLFAPICKEEFLRVLKSDGVIIAVFPGERHLMGLKSILYEKAYKNDTPLFDIKGLSLIDNKILDYDIRVDGNDNIENLFAMTPYFWRTPKEGSEKLHKLSSLSTPVEFIVNVYKKT